MKAGSDTFTALFPGTLISHWQVSPLDRSFGVAAYADPVAGLEIKLARADAAIIITMMNNHAI